MTRRILTAIDAAPWAIHPAALQTIREVAARMPVDGRALAEWKGADQEGAPSAVRTRAGERLQGTRSVRMRGGVAVLPLVGPIFPRANLLTEFSGGTSLQTFAFDLQAVIDNPDVGAILLDVDSPGGVASGVNEAARIIRSASQHKPVVAYVGGLGASAAYWLASAADELVVEETAMVGSIGVVFGVEVQEAPDRDGYRQFDIVSTGAPSKRPDFATEEGQAETRVWLDRLEARFIAAVAEHRGVSEQTVRNDFGQGGILVGADAVAAGMADRIGMFEDVLAGLAGRPGAGNGALPATQTEERPMGEQDQPAAEQQPGTEAAAEAVTDTVALDRARAEGRGEEKARIAAILNHAEAEGREGQARTLALETDLEAEAAGKVLASMPKAEAPAPAPAGDPGFAAAMAGVKNPDVGADDGDTDGEEDPAQAGAAAVAAAREQGLVA